MTSWIRLAPSLLVACALAAPALARSEDERLEAAASVIGLDMSVEAMIGYCEAAAPNAAAGLRPKWTAWRQDALVPQVSQALGPEKLARLRDGMARVATAAVGKLKQMGPPQTTCPQIAGWLKEGPFVTRTAYPALYEGLPAGGSPAFAAAPAPQAPAASAAPAGVYYTPAQLKALVASWWGPTRDYDRANRMLEQAGRLYIQGRVMARGDTFFLETNDGTFRSKLPVAVDLSDRELTPFTGRTITVEGRMQELPSGMVFLKETRIVDGAGLKPSPLPSEPGLYRLDVKPSQITAAPGAGLSPAQVQGLLHNGHGETGANGYEFREDVFLLLKDGTAYLGHAVAPSDLDIAKSRKLEPQLWARWRAKGAGFQILRQDDFGRPEGDWSDQPGHLTGAWKPNQRLNATYSAQAFHGSLALGGTYSSTAYRFSDDGRFEVIGYKQSGSGSMAAASGFTASGSGYSDGKGSRTSAGGGTAGVFAGSQSRSEDGASQRGVYRLEGLSLVLKYDDGRTESVLCAPWGADLTRIYMFGRTFSRS
ncbi:hypothetical protein [Caulobacter sp. BK020]|uniref:hypothetical protein n=1 Tax=Caulobacter sp. BK020 TaxID=2512117 RepID=UPI001048584C|nr:hypothetical protein [Caulobacter sp. BK020]